MKASKNSFNEHEVIHELKHYLPAQAPLKDFIHHNTLHAFQGLNFDEGLHKASVMFGYKVSLSLNEFRELYANKKIDSKILYRTIIKRKGINCVNEWADKVLQGKYDNPSAPRIGQLRGNWKSKYKIGLDAMVHPLLFRILCSYLDQGISMWNFPVLHYGFLASIREMERNSFTSFFKTEAAKNLLLSGNCQIKNLLNTLVGDPSLYKQYLFDQQFAHQGWSGIVSTIEDHPQFLIDRRKISIHDLIVFELLLEIDALNYQFGDGWLPLAAKIDEKPIDLFADVPYSELAEVLSIWQEAFEWTYYDQVLTGIITQKKKNEQPAVRNFQAIFCIDDRECSFRRYLEQVDPKCETFATPGFFNVEFYYQPEHGKSYTKQCPAPVKPKYLIKEAGVKGKRKKDLHFEKPAHSLFRGWLISQTLGFWSALKLALQIFRPSVSPATASSFLHMDQVSQLSIENKDINHLENGLQIGFTVEEMAQRVENLLKSIGLVKGFAPIVYVVGHGSSSVNNPHYAAYDCGACSGRPGSVNARVFCFMANHPKVREILALKDIFIPEQTQFVGGLHDTTRDEVVFYDEASLSEINTQKHEKNRAVFEMALDLNAKERSRRFNVTRSNRQPDKIHDWVKRRSVSLFEPRPELNHATNALCIIGSRELTKGLFLDRRAFLNSYDYEIDPDGHYLFNILKAAAPVCGGINLEYFFSRVDNRKLGAGTKLPHNVMGLFGVANGIDGDLRPGLPSQMIEVHDPVRLLMIVVHFPDVVLQTIKKSPETYEWFINEWVHLVVKNPESGALHYFKDGSFSVYEPLCSKVDKLDDLNPVLKSQKENIPVYFIS